MTRQIAPPVSSAPTQPSRDADGFIQVRRKTTGLAFNEQSTTSHLQNSFGSLAEMAHPETGTEGEGLPQWKGSAAGT